MNPRGIVRREPRRTGKVVHFFKWNQPGRKSRWLERRSLDGSYANPKKRRDGAERKRTERRVARR